MALCYQLVTDNDVMFGAGVVKFNYESVTSGHQRRVLALT